MLACCTQVHSEADARERASRVFQEFILKKNLDKGQYSGPRIIYNAVVEVWEASYEGKGLAEASNRVTILVDKYGRAELHVEKPQSGFRLKPSRAMRLWPWVCCATSADHGKNLQAPF